MKPAPSLPAIGVMIVAIVIIALVAWLILKHIIREQPATTERPAMPKQTSVHIGGAMNGLTTLAVKVTGANVRG